MQWLTILLIGVAANIDNLGISVSYGLKSKRIPFSQNLLIATISMIFAFVSMAAGSYLSLYFSQALANFAGGSLIIGIGIWFFISSPPFVKRDENTGKPSYSILLPKISEAKEITWKETAFLGFVLGINCLTIGFGAGFTGVSPFFASISIGLFSLASISLGVMLGNNIGNTLFGRYSNIVSGILLIIIGIYEIFI